MPAAAVLIDGGDLAIIAGAVGAVSTAMIAWRRFRPDTVSQITETVERALRIANEATVRAEENADRLSAELERRHSELQELRAAAAQGRRERELLQGQIRKLERRIAELESQLAIVQDDMR